MLFSRDRTSFFPEQQGSVTIFGLAILIMSTFFCAVVIDAANAWTFRQRLQNVADAAALAAVRELPNLQSARAAALEIVELNLPRVRFGETIKSEDIVFLQYDFATQAQTQVSDNDTRVANSVRVDVSRTSLRGGQVPTFVLGLLGVLDGWDIVGSATAASTPCPPPLLGRLTDYLFVFTRGADLTWGDPSPGYVGDIAVNGLDSKLSASGTYPYTGTIFTNASTLDGWERVLNNNPGTARASYSQRDRITSLTADFDAAVAAIRAMPVTPGFERVNLSHLNGLDTRDGENRTYVMNITSWSSTGVVRIWGDPGDTFIMRWDTDPSTSAMDGRVLFESGGGIDPRGELRPTNFVHLAGDISASSGGRVPDGLVQWVSGIQNQVTGGGFFTGYWLTLGASNGGTATTPYARFVGGWFTRTNKFKFHTDSAGIRVPLPTEGLLVCPAQSSRLIY
jgi:Flp pilus assembly protein TadG